MELTSGKVAVVTGAASGIGLALAERFARAGINVVMADVEQPALQAASEKIAGLGGRALAVPTDVSDEAAVNTLAAAAVDRFGAVHVVCNNAGVASLADPWFGPLSAWKWVLGVNLWGVIHGIRAFLPVMAAQAEGHIVNTASVAGLVPGIGPSYDATKHAVVAISEDLYQAMTGNAARRGQRLVPGLGSHQHRPSRPQLVTEPGGGPRAGGDRRGDGTARAARDRRRDGACRRGRPGSGRHHRQPVLGIHRPSFHPDGTRPMAAHRRRPHPQTDVDMPGLPPAKQLIAEIQQLLAGPGGALWLPGGPGPPADGTTWSRMTTEAAEAVWPPLLRRLGERRTLGRVSN